MILIGLGTNLPLADQRSGQRVLEDALAALSERKVQPVSVSPFYRSEPVPVSDQDWYVNAVAQVQTDLDPAGLLAVLHGVEADFGRVRGARNAARTLDLDLLAFHELIRAETDAAPHIPHPRMQDRAFVLYPLKDVAPDWCHPVTGASLSQMIKSLPKNQRLEPLAI